MTDAAPPEPVVEGPKVAAGWRISAVWLVPLLALIVTLAVAWRSYSERGPLIEIAFQSAAGIEPGQTTLRYRDVTVGVVEDLRFTDDLRSVVVIVRIDQSVARFVDADAQFWVVRPSVTAQGVRGIETVLSGIYIEAYWDGVSGRPASEFVGLETRPLTPADQPGLRVRLRALSGGSANVGAPVLFKGIQVGSIETIELTDAGEVVMDVFVNAPHHLRLTEDTRFWNASGFDIQIGASGARLNVDSLVSLLQGGVAFDTVGSATEQVAAGHLYELYASETLARQNVFENLPGNRVAVDVYFNESVRGLNPGAPVEYGGIRVGEVTALQAALQPSQAGAQVALRATLGIVPQRLGIAPGADDAAAALDLLEELVAQGLRAQLTATNLLAQSLYVDLVNAPDAVAAALDRTAEPYPVLPSLPADTAGIAASAEGVLQRISNLPVEELIDTAVTLLANVNSLISDERVRSAPENLGLLLGDMREIVSDSGLREAPAELIAVLAAARALIEDATEREVVANLAAALDATRLAVASIGAAADGAPALLAEIEGLAAEARALPLEELVAGGTRLLGDVDAFLQSEGVADLPASLDASLAEVRSLLDDLRAGGAVENLNATLASTRAITDALAAADLVASIETAVAEARLAAETVGAASSQLPALVDSLTALSDGAGALPLDELVASATRVLGAVDTVLQGEGVAELPPRLSAAIEEVRLLLAELREGGAVNSVNATLASADQAAAAVEAAVADLPDLVARLGQVADRADAALASVSPGSQINRDTEMLLREVRDAARAVRDLVTALERRPNSVLFGR